MEAGQQLILEIQMEFFDWLDSLEPQTTTEKLVPQHISAWMDQVTPKKAQNSAMFALLAGSTCVLSAVGMGCELEARNQPRLTG